MSMLSKIGLGIYYRIRRFRKALKNWRKFGVLMFGSLFLASTLGATSGISADPVLTIVQVQPSGAIVAQGGTKQFNAQAIDQYGMPITSGVTYSWSIVTAAAGSINQAGLFTAGSTAGQYNNSIKVVATKGASTKTAYASVTVSGSGGGGEQEQKILTTVTVSPSGATLAKGANKQFNAAAYDQYGQPITTGVTYSWSVVTTTAGSINQSGYFTAGQTAGEYNNSVKVTATKGSSTKVAYADVTVQGGGGQPQLVLTVVTVSPSGAIMNKGANKQFNAAAYDQYGAPLSGVSFSWQVTNTTAGSVNQSGYFTAGQTAGQYNDVVKVTGTKGSVSKFAYADITVSQTPPANLPPNAVITANPSSGTTSLTTTLNASASTDSDGTIVNYRWDRDGNGTFEHNSGTNSTITYTYGVGTWYPRVQVTDNDGATDTATVATGVVVQPGSSNLPPNAVITASPNSGSVSVVATLDASASTDSDGTIVNYRWDRDGNGTFEYNSGNNSTITYTYGIGTWYPRVQVTDNDGATDTATVATAIVVQPGAANLPPNAVITANPSSGTTSLTTTLNASASTDSDGTIVNYRWDRDGNGTFEHNSGTNSTITYTYGVGTWYPRVQVTDNDGATDTATVMTAIVVDDQPPVEPQLSYVVVNPNYWVMNMNTTKLFDAVSYDQNNQVIPDNLVDYYWDVINGGGTINSSTGLFTAGSTSGDFGHTVRVRAIYLGNTRYGYARVIVNPIITQAVLDRVDIIPPSITIDRNQSYDFDALAYDTNNTQLFSGVNYYWSVISGPGSVDQSGRYTATNSTNTATIQVEASQGNIRVYDTALIYIRNGGDNCSGILSYVVITPQVGYVGVGRSIDYDATAYDTTGCPVSAEIIFSARANVPGGINASGYFTAQYTTGTFNDGVQVSAYRDGRTVYDYADVVITGDTPTPTNYYIDASLRAYDETIGSEYQTNEGDTVLYTLKLTNNRTNALTGVTVSMEVPEYTTFISVSAQSGIPSINGRMITWVAGSLYAGESKTMWLRVRVKDGVPTYATIRGKAFVKAYELSNGFWVYANDLPVNGSGGDEPYEPLTPTGAMEWILAAISALLATILTRQLLKTRQLIASLK